MAEGILPPPRDVSLTLCYSAALTSPTLADGSVLVDGGGYASPYQEKSSFLL